MAFPTLNDTNNDYFRDIALPPEFADMMDWEITQAVVLTNTFHPFSRLPTELRDMIWELAVPGPRLVEVHFNANLKEQCSGEDDAVTRRKPLKHRFLAKLPVLLHVCRDSRAIGLKYYELALGCKGYSKPVFFNFKEDILYPLIPVGGTFSESGFLIYLPRGEEIQRYALDYRHGPLRNISRFKSVFRILKVKELVVFGEPLTRHSIPFGESKSIKSTALHRGGYCFRGAVCMYKQEDAILKYPGQFVNDANINKIKKWWRDRDLFGKCSTCSTDKKVHSASPCQCEMPQLVTNLGVCWRGIHDEKLHEVAGAELYGMPWTWGYYSSGRR